LIKSDEIVREKYESSFSPEFKKILEAYSAALNRYAELHPEEVLHKKLFPVSPIDIVKGYFLSMAFISNVHFDLGRLFQTQMDPIRIVNPDKMPAGSNGFAYAPHKTEEGKTILVSNSHQPFRSYLSWYEIHINSEEGWNFIGATFAGGVTPFIGTNNDLGWTHCVNYHDFHDVFELTMHPKNKLDYKFDGEWLKLEERTWKAKVKAGFLKVGVKKKFYWSKYGPVIKNKQGFFALRFSSGFVIGAAEQWYHMNKARSLEEFKTILGQQELPCLAIVYADKEGNILLVDNGLFPNRNENYNWQYIVPGDTSATLWEPVFMPMENILQVENPSSGYVFHMNGTGFNSTSDEENPLPENYNKTMGYTIRNASRQLRFKSMIAPYDKLTYQDIKKIKYDQHRQFPLYTKTIENWDDLRHVSPQEFPSLRDIIEIFSKWTGEADIHNKQAAIFVLAGNHIAEFTNNHGIGDRAGSIPEDVFPAALEYAKKYLLKHFGKLEIELGDLQKHVRGDKVLPIGGVPESIAAMYVVPYKKGVKQSNLGDSFVLFATYGKSGVEKIETINCYGASNRPESPHYSDQMEMYVNQKTKLMTLNKEKIMKEAKRSYHPR
jgi:acyl-homoserine-lactone acylase